MCKYVQFKKPSYVMKSFSSSNVTRPSLLREESGYAGSIF